MQRLTWVVWCVVVSGCLAPPVVFAPPAGDEVTVFVHGYKGARLDTPQGETAWVTPGAAFSAGEKSLAYSFEGQREFAKFGPLAPNGTLTKLTVLPGIIEEDAYLSFIEWGRDALPGFMTFAYDWRQDVRTSGAQLCAFIESLGPNKRVRLMAHSMGGMVTMECLRKGPEAVRARVTHVAFFGAVFGGAPAIFDDVLTGSKTGANTTLLSREALLTFSSSWQLLPPKADYTFDAQGAAVDVYSAEKFAWGLFAEDDVKNRPEYRAQLAKRLEEHAGVWADLLEGETPQQTWKAIAFVGTGLPTQAGWRQLPNGQFDTEHPIFADGDGLVLVPRAHPFPSVKSKVVEIDDEHSGMLKDPRVQQLVIDFFKAP